MDNEKLEKELKSYFQSEFENVEPPSEWWQRAISRASAYSQDQNTNLLYKNLRNIIAKLEQRAKSALTLLHINYKAPLFKIPVYALLAILLISLSAVGIRFAIGNMAEFGNSPPVGTKSIPITIIGLDEGEEATLLIGVEAGSLEIQDTLSEYSIQGTGTDLTKTITPNLEDGYYLIELDVPGKYAVGVRAYSFMVRDSVIVNPTGRAATFELGLQPDYSTVGFVISLSAPPKEPMPTVSALQVQEPLWQRVLMPLAISVSLIVVALLVVVVKRRRSQI